MNYPLPFLSYLDEVLDEHTLPLEDVGTGLIEAVWLLKMIAKTRGAYKKHGTI